MLSSTREMSVTTTTVSVSALHGETRSWTPVGARDVEALARASVLELLRGQVGQAVVDAGPGEDATSECRRVEHLDRGHARSSD